MGEKRASWALDNVIIGGNEVNDFSLSENFETSSGTGLLSTSLTCTRIITLLIFRFFWHF